ncbi:class F sortase [Candidatus Parcubacteria bacterium]|nr:class F sortase [Candidatus Parcubacteria bacterium]
MSKLQNQSGKILLTVGALAILILVGGITLESRMQAAGGTSDVGTGTGVTSDNSHVALAADTESTSVTSRTETSRDSGSISSIGTQRNTGTTENGTLTRTETSSQLVIPKIGVDANIQSVGLGKGGSIGIPTNFTDVAWYNGSAKLGTSGVSIIDGHLDGRYTPRAVFYDLSQLAPGDTVKVVTNDKTYTYKVSHIEVYDYKSNPDEIFKNGDSKGHLNLITCTGDWVKNEKTYDERVVVFTDLVN